MSSSSSSSSLTPSVLNDIRQSTSLVLSLSSSKPVSQRHVWIDETKLKEEIDAHPEIYSQKLLPPSWRQDYHFFEEANTQTQKVIATLADGTQLTEADERNILYILVLDAVNYCFWPCEGYEYADLAGSLKTVLLRDPAAFSPERLVKATEEEVAAWLQPPNPQQYSFGQYYDYIEKKQGKEVREQLLANKTPITIPLLAQRTRSIREVGYALLTQSSGSAITFIQQAQQSAAKLVEMISAHLPAFRDSCIYQGYQVFLYKRAQILVGDIWGAYEGTSLGHFIDIQHVTCFADYRVPQVLRAVGIMQYSDTLSQIIDNKEEIVQSELEIELRACTIQAVEKMVTLLNSRKTDTDTDTTHIIPVQLDWLLWERGEASLDKLLPHHRTRTIFY